MKKPNMHNGLRHIALFIKKFEACAQFYTEILGLKIVWQPDENNIYLSSGNDNLALHRASKSFEPNPSQHLDHIGFFLTQKNDVDEWYDYLKAMHCDIKASPKDHRDGTRSLYCADPDGNVIQLIYYPTPE